MNAILWRATSLVFGVMDRIKNLAQLRECSSVATDLGMWGTTRAEILRHAPFCSADCQPHNRRPQLAVAACLVGRRPGRARRQRRLAVAAVRPTPTPDAARPRRHATSDCAGAWANSLSSTSLHPPRACLTAFHRGGGGALPPPSPRDGAAVGWPRAALRHHRAFSGRTCGCNNLGVTLARDARPRRRVHISSPRPRLLAPSSCPAGGTRRRIVQRLPLRVSPTTVRVIR